MEMCYDSSGVRRFEKQGAVWDGIILKLNYKGGEGVICWWNSAQAVGLCFVGEMEANLAMASRAGMHISRCVSQPAVKQSACIEEQHTR